MCRKVKDDNFFHVFRSGNQQVWMSWRKPTLTFTSVLYSWPAASNQQTGCQAQLAAKCLVCVCVYLRASLCAHGGCIWSSPCCTLVAPWFNYIEPVLWLNINLGGPNSICLAMWDTGPYGRMQNPASVCLSCLLWDTEGPVTALRGRAISLGGRPSTGARTNTHTHRGKEGSREGRMRTVGWEKVCSTLIMI